MVALAAPSSARRTGGKRSALGYDSAETSSKRINRKTNLRTEDALLKGRKRDGLTSKIRDAGRNMPDAAWAIRTHLGHVARHTFQGQHADRAFNRRLERLYKRHAKRIDTAGRHSLNRLVWLAERAAVTDGDCFAHVDAKGLVTIIEGDRIGKPDLGTPDDYDDTKVVNGVEIDPQGRATRYCLGYRNDGGQLVFQKWLKAADVYQHGYFERIGQVRGVSPIAAALNPWQDIAEAKTYALARAKVEQLLGLKIKRSATNALGVGDPTAPNPTPAGEPTDESETTEETGYDIDFSAGPVTLDLLPGDDADFLQAQSPHANFQAFVKQMLMSALKALDLDFSFYDSSHTNYSGARQAVLSYKLTSAIRREAVQDLCEWIANRVLAVALPAWVAAGLIVLPADVPDASALLFAFFALGMGWIDPLKETKAHGEQVGKNMNSLQRICRERDGSDWFEIADERGAEVAYARKLGIPDGTVVGTDTPGLDEPDIEDADDEAPAGGAGTPQPALVGAE